jgi:hypothetical protein
MWNLALKERDERRADRQPLFSWNTLFKFDDLVSNLEVKE